MTPIAVARQTKGEATRSQILAAAVEQASTSGFESLTIGTLAEKIGMSKSGLFAHFGSKIELQLAALDEAARQFTEEVYMPALKAPRGVKRLRTLLDNWVTWPQRAKLPGGCPVDAASREYMHQPGPMREAALDRQRQLDRELTKTVQMAIDSGELKAGTDARQLAFAVMGMVLAATRIAPLHGWEAARNHALAAFDQLIETHRHR